MVSVNYLSVLTSDSIPCEYIIYFGDKDSPINHDSSYRKDRWIQAWEWVHRGLPWAGRNQLWCEQCGRWQESGRIPKQVGREDVYTPLCNLSALAKLSTKTHEELSMLLKNHFALKRVVITERFHFYCQNQALEESIAEFVTELQKLSMQCNFRDKQLEEALRDCLVCEL